MEVVRDFIPEGRRNRPGHLLEPTSITIHDTGNPNAGADAAAHARYVKGDVAASRPVSWHFTVDEGAVYQHLPTNEVAWHAGDGGSGPGNRTSLAVEICQNVDGDRLRAETNATWLVADLLLQFGLGIDAVVQHHKWSSKNCPAVLRGRQGGWQGFLKAVESYMEHGTEIKGETQATVSQAQAWARARGAHQRFVEIAPVYWEYGRQTGIRPEVLYAQSAKETAFGRYGGAVTPDQNNWAGIKTEVAMGDRREDHQAFPTPQEGVRAHFNHLTAYIGLPPVGTPHPRYHLVKGLSWAGTVRFVEQLGGKWAPNLDYGRSIVRDYLVPLLATENPDVPDYRATIRTLEEALEREAARREAAEERLQRIQRIATGEE